MSDVTKVESLANDLEKQKKIKKIKDKIEMKNIENDLNEQLSSKKTKTKIKLPTVKVIPNKQNPKEYVPMNEKGEYVYTDYLNNVKDLIINGMDKFTFQNENFTKDLHRSNDLQVGLASIFSKYEITNHYLGVLMTIAGLSAKHALEYVSKQQEQQRQQIQQVPVENHEIV